MKKPEIIVNSPKCEDFHRHIALTENVDQVYQGIKTKWKELDTFDWVF